MIHYAAPNGKIYPFCAYNSGPIYREKIEKQFSIPFEQQLERFNFAPANADSKGCSCGNGSNCCEKKSV